MQNLFLIALCLAVSAITYHFAKKRGRNPQLWALIGFLFGLLGLLVLFLLPSKKPRLSSKQQDPAARPFFHEPMIEIIDPAHAEKLWYYLDGGNQQLGPMSLNALSNAWEEGKVNAKTYVWNEELANWQHFEEVLKPLGAPA